MQKNKQYCPLLKRTCIKCHFWLEAGQKVTNLETGESRIKDTSCCAIKKSGEYASMRLWQETERTINEVDK